MLLVGIMLGNFTLFSQISDALQIVLLASERILTGCPRLHIIGDMLYVPGLDGIKRRAIGVVAKWESLAIQGVNVLDFCISGGARCATSSGDNPGRSLCCF